MPEPKVFDSANLMRSILRFADEWKNEMAQHLPEPFPASELMQAVASQIADLPGVEHVTLQEA